MKKRPLVILGTTLLLIAGIAVLLPRLAGPDQAKSPGEAGASRTLTGPRAASPRDAVRFPAGESPSPGSDEAGPEVDEHGIVDPEAYDADRDGTPELGTYVRLYSRLKTSAGKCDMLQNVRILDPLDDPVVNDLLIREAAGSEDPEIRQAARDALFEYGAMNSHAALADFIATQRGIFDLEELKRTLDKLKLPTLNMHREDG
jgi:hypothetical protein